MRERWFGATGRKVPAIVLEGTVELAGALDRSTTSPMWRRSTKLITRALRSWSAARSAEDVHAALSLGPIACALVTDESLLSLDLAEMTYG